MARPLRMERAGAWHHVTARGTERRVIFADDRDRRRWTELIAEAVAREHRGQVSTFNNKDWLGGLVDYCAMARPLRMERAGAWYHVTVRGTERRVIFADDRSGGSFGTTRCEKLSNRSSNC